MGTLFKALTGYETGLDLLLLSFCDFFRAFVIACKKWKTYITLAEVNFAN